MALAVHWNIHHRWAERSSEQRVRSKTVLMLKDIEAAERRFNEAAAELRKYESDPEEWRGAIETMPQVGKRVLNLADAHFDRLEQLRRNMNQARASMVAARQAWSEGR
ncbi:hypothetical protein [Actinopolymorpha cephalotaxi]|uniref:Excreted virulence factor EspC, type VII ESX diderm n=1 Tax=Actinopolymorpha cephalotaxi TaxID=504797 RepID=A0ABX2SAK8_9ACTN|nr:hypothetical protein [Actinopolymorpha cephalotaxi]NYH86660.1 hypothetical protein [Actinopolymorpha cephalotaxi]